MKKIPETIFRKTGHLESRGGNLTFDAEEMIKKNLTDEQNKLFEDKKILTRNGRALIIFDFNSFKKSFS